MPVTNPTSTSLDPLAELDAAGAHWVLVRPSKAPIAGAWQQRPADLDAVREWMGKKAGNLVGVIPASIDLTVVDVDQQLPLRAKQTWRHRGLVTIGETAVTAALGKPICSVQTRSGGRHLLYRGPDTDPVRNARWRYGDVRGSAGFVVVWDAAALVAAVRCRERHEAVDVGRLPERWPAGFGPALVALTAEGARSNTLNEEVFKDGRRGRLTPDAETAYQLAGETCGLPARDVAATIASARNGAVRATPAPNGKHRPRRTDQPGLSESAGSRVDIGELTKNGLVRALTVVDAEIWMACVEAPRAVSSTARPTRPPCEVLRPSRPAAAQAAANRRFDLVDAEADDRIPRFRGGRGMQAADRGRAAADQTSHVRSTPGRVGLRAADGDNDVIAVAEIDVGPAERDDLTATEGAVEQQGDDHTVDQAAALGGLRALEAAAGAARVEAGSEDGGALVGGEASGLAAAGRRPRPFAETPRARAE